MTDGSRELPPAARATPTSQPDARERSNGASVARDTPAAPRLARDRTRADRWILLGVFLVAFVLRYVAVRQYGAHHPNADHPAIDEAAYDEWAQRIAAGDWLGKEVFFQEPLYPYALGVLYAVAGPDRLLVRVVQCALWAATAVLAGILGRALFGRAAGLLAACAIALYGPGMLFPSFLLKENLLLPLLTLLALVLVRTHAAVEDPSAVREQRLWWLAAGGIAGLGALLRGNVLVLLPFLALWPVFRAWRRRRSLALGAVEGAGFLAGAAIVLLPVAVRNLAVGGVFLPTTSGAGTNLYAGNQLGNPYGRASEIGFVRGIPEHEAGDWRREAERRAGRALDPGEVSAYWRNETLRSLREHPGAHLAILARKLRLSLGRYEVPDNHFLPWDALYVPLARAPWPAFGLVGTLGLAGLLLLLMFVRFGERGPLLSALPPSFDAANPGAAADVACLVFAYLATIVLTVTSDRARLPLVPLLAPFAGWALVWGARAAAQRNQDAIVRFVLALFLGVLAVYPRVLPEAEIAEEHDEREQNLAVQRLEEGRTEDARAIAERLVRDHPESARSRILLAEVGFRSALQRAPSSASERASESPERRVDRAELDAALAQISPLLEEPRLPARERFRAASLAAWIELERAEFGEAQKQFRRARGFDADDRDLREGLARAMIGSNLGQAPADARSSAEEALALLDRLREERGADLKRLELELLTAQAEFLRGRAILDGPHADDRLRKLGQESVQAALDRLKEWREGDAVPVEMRRRVRMLAGGIQLWRGNWKAAENHYRAALALGQGIEARLGLAQALVRSLGDERGTWDRTARLGEAERLLSELKSAGWDPPQVEDLERRLERAR